MTQIINPDEPPKLKKAVDGKELPTETTTSQITNNDDEDALKNDSDNNEDQNEPLPVKELQKDLEDEDTLDKQAETSGVL